MIAVGDQVHILLDARGDQWTRETVTVLAIGDHRPSDASPVPASIAHLSNGTWEFVWNLKLSTPSTKGNARPIFGKRAARGMAAIIPTIPSLHDMEDTDLAAAYRYLVDFTAWHANPKTIAKRIKRGQSIKNFKKNTCT